MVETYIYTATSVMRAQSEYNCVPPYIYIYPLIIYHIHICVIVSQYHFLQKKYPKVSGSIYPDRFTHPAWMTVSLILHGGHTTKTDFVSLTILLWAIHRESLGGLPG